MHTLRKAAGLGVLFVFLFTSACGGAMSAGRSATYGECGGGARGLGGGDRTPRPPLP